MPEIRIGFTRGFFDQSGAPTMPEYDIGVLHNDDQIEIVRLNNGIHIAAKDIRDLDVLFSLTQEATIDDESFSADGRLSLICRAGVGYEDIDVPACTANGVALSITSDAVRRPTAVAALTHILAITTALIEKHAITKRGPEAWPSAAWRKSVHLEGKVLGIIGLGNIGAELVRLSAPLGFQFVAHDRFASATLAAELKVALVDLDTLLRTADIVSIHCPLNDQTRSLINAERLAMMKPTAFLVNTARGGIVDHAALTAALRERRIAGAGLDVFDPEPLPRDDPLLALDNAVFSAHALNWTDNLDSRIAEENVEATLDVLAGRAPRGLVNRDVLDQPIFQAKLKQYGISANEG